MHIKLDKVLDKATPIKQHCKINYLE